MGAITYSQEISSVVAPSRLFKALVLDSPNVLPKVFPDNIKSVEFIDGDGGVGSIKKIDFGESSHIKYTKHRISALDADNFYCKYTMIKSNIKFGEINSILNEVKLTETENGCICKMTTKYHVKKGAELGEDRLKKGKEILLGLFKAVEGYLVEHPDLSA